MDWKDIMEDGSDTLLLDRLLDSLHNSVDDATTENIRRAEAMIGVSNFTDVCEEMVSAWKSMQGSTALRDVFFRQAYLFFVDSGRGYHTALDILWSLLVLWEIVPPECRLMEQNLSSGDKYEENFYVLQEYLNSDAVGLLALDLRNAVNEAEKPFFRQLLRDLSDTVMKNHTLLVLRFPYLDKDKTEQLRQALSWDLSAKAVVFEPFTDAETLAYARSVLGKLAFDLDAGGEAAYLERVQAARASGMFYGTRTMSQILGEAVRAYMTGRGTSACLDRSMVYAGSPLPYRQPYESELSSGDKTDELCLAAGMEENTAKAEMIVRRIIAAKKRGDGSPYANVCLTGNPNTGKTAVARQIARSLRDCGFLRSGRLTVCSGTDLIGQHPGQTPQLTRSISEKARGSALYIREACALAGRSGDSQAAVAELTAQMESHRDDLVVILSGNQDAIERMFADYPSLRRCFPYHIHIPNCTAEQLASIYMGVLRESRRRAGEHGCATNWDAAFEAYAHSFFDGIGEEERCGSGFGNGAYARTLAEETLAQALQRINAGRPLRDTSCDLTLTTADFDNAAAQIQRV